MRPSQAVLKRPIRTLVDALSFSRRSFEMARSTRGSKPSLRPMAIWSGSGRRARRSWWSKTKERARARGLRFTLVFSALRVSARARISERSTRSGASCRETPWRWLSTRREDGSEGTSISSVPTATPCRTTTPLRQPESSEAFGAHAWNVPVSSLKSMCGQALARRQRDAGWWLRAWRSETALVPPTIKLQSAGPQLRSRLRPQRRRGPRGFETP